jgi:ABC-type Zn uptake system ZnuABC Zn-binding protein ZnuA
MNSSFRDAWFGLVIAVTLVCQERAAARPLKILTSFVPVYCLAAGVAGELASVENLLPGNVDPHDYQLAPRDLARFAGADLLVINGLALEDWLLKVLGSTRGQHQPVVVELAAGLSTNQLVYDADAPWAQLSKGRSPGEKRLPNPHIWLDPQLAQHGVTNICRALQKADPVNADGYARNAAACVNRLRQLDDEFKTAAASFSRRDIVTDHNAFAYLAGRYGLNIVGVVQEVDDVPPSPRQLARLEDVMRQKHIQVIFTSPPIPQREAKQIAFDLAISVATLNTIEIGPLQPSTYEDEMRQNLKTLQQYLR